MPHRFNHRCDGCSACARQCPTGAIFGELKVRFWVIPRLCVDCGVCGLICRVGAVEDAFGRIAAPLPRDRRPRPRVDRDACNGCYVCVDYCPFGCLEVVGGLHSGVSALTRPLACVSCGECADICAKGAVTMASLELPDYQPAREIADHDAYLAATYLEAAEGRP